MTSRTNQAAGRKRSFFRAILNGMALPAEVETKHVYRRLKGSDLDRIRGDVFRVGGTFKRVIDRENGPIKGRAITLGVVTDRENGHEKEPAAAAAKSETA